MCSICGLLKKYYFYLFTPIYLFCIYLVYANNKFVSLLIPATAAYLSLIYFFQKQRLEELKVFKQLFTEFNNRYDDLNGKLYAIKQEDEKVNFHETMDDYFNLCAEEYLFFTKGLILDEVWGSWCRGIQEHLKTKKIKDYCLKAQEENSFYSLTLQKIEKGAQLGL